MYPTRQSNVKLATVKYIALQTVLTIVWSSLIRCQYHENEVSQKSVASSPSGYIHGEVALCVQVTAPPGELKASQTHSALKETLWGYVRCYKVCIITQGVTILSFVNTSN